MNPLLFDTTFLTLYSLWFFSCLGLFLGIYIFTKLAQKSRLRIQFLADISLQVLIGGLVTGRIFAIFANAQYYFYDFGLAKIYQMLAFWQDKEISFWGSILGAIVIFIRNAHKKQENLTKWGDIFVVSTLFALTIGNFGAYLDGVNHGKVTSLPIGVTFISSIVRFTDPVHPTQLYATFYCLTLAIILYKLLKKYRNQFDGLIFWLGLTSFSFFKVLEGFFRGDEVVMLWKFRFPELCFFLMFLYSLNKLYNYQKRNQVPFLRKFDYYYGKLLNLVHIKK